LLLIKKDTFDFYWAFLLLKKNICLNIIFSILVKRPLRKGRVDVSICHWNILAFKEILKGLSAEVKFQLFFHFFPPLRILKE